MDGSIIFLFVFFFSFLMIEVTVERRSLNQEVAYFKYSENDLKDLKRDFETIVELNRTNKIAHLDLIEVKLPFLKVFNLLEDEQNTRFVDRSDYKYEPYRYEGRVFFQISSNNWGSCSGTVIGKNLFLTAGHCVMQENKNELFRKIAFVPQYFSTSFDSEGAFWAEKVAYFDEWKRSRTLSRDVAIVQVGKNTRGYFTELEDVVGGHADLELNCLSVGKKIMVLGYPSTPYPYDGSKMVVTSTSIFRMEDWWGNPGMWLYHSDLSSGSSGGGVFNADLGSEMFDSEVCGLNSARVNNMNYLISPWFDERVGKLLENFDEV